MMISRREFLRNSGMLVVSFAAAAPPVVGTLAMESFVMEPFALGQGPFDTHRSHIDPALLDSWIAVAADGAVTAFTGKCDFGQGMLTAQTQLVAEELCVAFSAVKVLQCDTDRTPDQGTTSGSQSTPTNFNVRNLAMAAATARDALLGMAAKRFGDAVEQLKVADGVITAADGRKVTYGELIGDKRFNLSLTAVPLKSAAKRRSPDSWTILGKPVPSLDRVALMTGQFEFVHNVRVPGMVHGRVVRPPEMGATVVSVDRNSVAGIAGVVQVVVRKNFVGVVAEKQWQAIQAARELKVVWGRGTGLVPQAKFYEELRKQPSSDTALVDSEDVDQQLAKAKAVLEATYVYPYQMHGSMGSSCAVADVKGDRATVWSATQSVYPTRSCVAKLLELPLENVRVIYVRGSGCYGLNGADTVSFDAALMSHAVGRPVRVQLSRQDEMAWENYGSACVIKQRAGVDGNGAIAAWESETWAASRGGRPGYEQPGNVVTGMLAGFETETVEAGAQSSSPQKPNAGLGQSARKEPRTPLRNNGNAVPSYLAGCVGGNCGGAGTIRSERVIMHEVNSLFFTGPLRSPVRLQNTFAHESFMDEIAARVKMDPVELRLRHLRDERLVGVVKAAAQAAKWEKRASPQANAAGAGMVSGRGISCVVYEGDNGYAALVAEVEVDRRSGNVTPRKFTVAIDCGPISNPDGLRNQTEGGILQGMSRALGECVTWDERRVTSVDWRSYKSLYLGMELPVIEVVLVDRLDVPATGAGETAITLVAGAIGNAIFDATGARVREVPFTAERVGESLNHLVIETSE
jgi:nicotinate dehydrogenase subunit B